MKIIRYISFVILLLSFNNLFAQSLTGVAYDFYTENDYVKARIAIDSAVHTNERFDSQTWQLRGIIYRSIADGDQLYYRQIAIESFVQAKGIDTAGVYSDKIDNYLRNTIIRYYNDAVILLTEQKEFEKSEISYENYKKQYKTLLDPSFDFSRSDIDYYNGVASEYLIKADFVEPKKKVPLREKALVYCDKVIQIDSLDFKANFNMGVIHYNNAVDLLMIVDPEISIDDLMKNQEKAAKEFLKALPFLLRAEILDPENIEVKEALMGCYYGLHKNELYLKYQTIVDEYNLPFYERRFVTHPRDKENVKQLIRIHTRTIIDEQKAMFYTDVLNDLENE